MGNIRYMHLNEKGKNSRLKAKLLNDVTFVDFYYRLQEIAINMFEWENLPDSVDERFLEMILYQHGYAVYFNDEEIGNLALSCMIGAPLNVYGIPIYRRAYAPNRYQKELTEKDSVIIFNNRLHQPSILTVQLYAERLTEIQRAIDVNVKAQKTPIAILCDEHERLTYENIYRKYDGNEPLILGANSLDLNNIKSLNTSAPYVADKLFTLKRQIWNEALTFFGVENSSSEKKERLITDEVISNMGGVEAQRYIMLNARRDAVDKINKMFGTNIKVNFRQERSPFNINMPTTTTTDEAEIYTGGDSIDV